MVNNAIPIQPLQDEYAKKKSAALLSHVLNFISKKGCISFSEYMNLVLYTPELGYYSGELLKFGPQGDFITAPEISPIFSQCIANNFQGLALELQTEMSILEFGAGSGKMAAHILITLEEKQALPKHYFILEVSAFLKKQQRETLEALCPHLISRVVWLDSIENFQFTGLILGNEVLDAMPVRLFSLSNHELKEFFVIEKNGNLVFEKKPAQVPEDFPKIETDTNAHEIIFEVNEFIRPWIQTISQVLVKGACLIIDYGFPRSELYHPDRTMGTLMCHYRHKAHHDPLLNPGLQDITAHVDFTLVAESAVDAGLELLGFTNQASFLINSGLIELLKNSQQKDERDKIKENQAVQILTSPSEMGELIKAIAFGKGVDSLIGFSHHNQIHRL